jgi:hypothetical protein
LHEWARIACEPNVVDELGGFPRQHKRDVCKEQPRESGIESKEMASRETLGSVRQIRKKIVVEERNREEGTAGLGESGRV